MASFKMIGTIKVINDTMQVTDKFTKREFVLNDGEGQYPQDIMFQLTQDKVDYMDKFVLGETVEVSFNLRGREWTSPKGEVKYFNTLEAWRVDEVKGNENPVQKPDSKKASNSKEDDDDLPF